MAGGYLKKVLLSLPFAWATTAITTTAITTTAVAATPAVPSESGADIDPATITEPPNITTGGAGTTSGITGADMGEEDEGSGSGQTRGDDLFQTPAAATDAGPAYETETPEQSGAGAGEGTTGATGAGAGEGTTGATGDEVDESSTGPDTEADAAAETETNTDSETESTQQLLPDEPLGAADSGRREDGEPQASSSDSDS